MELNEGKTLTTTSRRFPADWRLVLLRRHVHVRPKATAAGVAGRDAATLASIRNAVASPCQGPWKNGGEKGAKHKEIEILSY